MGDGARRRAPLALQALLAAAALAFGAAAVAFTVWTDAGQGEYEELARELATVPATVREPEAPGEEAAAWSWDVDGAAAWLTVAGTPIDYPVAAQDPDDPDYYLRHDLWGSWSLVGCPFLDARCASEDARQLLVFGHHIAYTDYAFSCLQRAYEQDVFDSIGPASWSTRAAGSTYLPLCAMAVDESYAKVQSFDAGSAEALREWLSSLLADAGAVAPDAASLASRATGALCLVTCTSDWSGQPGRTVVVFARVEGGV